MKKLLCLLLALITLTLPFTACTDGTGSDNETQPNTEETTDTTEPETGLNIIKDGKSDAVIIYPSRNSQLRNAVSNMVNTIDRKFSLWLDTSRDDYLEADDQRIEILVGKTDRPESSMAMEKLSKAGDFFVGVIGNKLVITGLNDMSTETAINYFLANKVLSSSDPDLIFKEENNYIFEKTYSVKLDTCAGNDLNDYAIVYPKDSLLGEYYVALNLRYHLFIHVGIDIPVIDDSVAASGKEILIGKTNRELTPDTDEGTFSVSIKEQNLCVSANDLLGFVGAEAYLTDTLFTKKSNTDILTDTFSHTAESETLPQRAGDYRIIFNNIWGTAEEEYANRDEYAVAFYLAYKPDVLALNEFWDDFRGNTVIKKTLLENGYEEVIAPAMTEIKGNIGNPENNVLPIFYNPQKLKLVYSAYYHSQWYEKGVTAEQVENGTATLTTADDSKGITIAVFEGLDENGNGNGERFIVCNTHFTSNYYNETHGYYSRLHDIEVLWSIVEPLSKEYPDASVLLGCDYNCNISSDEIAKLKGYGFESCHDTAEVADNQVSHHGYPTYNEYFGYFVSGSYSKNATYDTSIDHIFQYGNTVEAKVFDTLTTDYTALMADHSPLLLDFNVTATSAGQS